MTKQQQQNEITMLAPSTPYSREAEEATIGALLINPEPFWSVSQFLRSDDFYIDRHRWIWEAIETLAKVRQAIDIMTLCEMLDKRGQLDEIGGPAYVTGLINKAPVSYNVESYARIIEGYSIRRQMIALANNIAAAAYDKETEIDHYADDLREQLRGFRTVQDGSAFKPLSKVLSNVFTDIEERAKHPGENGLKLGLPKLDKAIIGLEPQEIIYLSGEPKIGKTRLALSWALNLGLQAAGAVISLEMSELAIGRRLLSSLASVPTSRMRGGDLYEGDWPLLTHALDNEDRPLFISDANYTSQQLRGALTALKREQGIEFVIVDYALLMSDQARNEIEKTQLVSSNFKQTCKELELAGIMLHSVTKAGMRGERNIADMRGSGQQIHDADFIFKLTHVKNEITGIPTAVKDKLRILWIEAARDMENPLVKIPLAPKANTPYFGEYDQHIVDEDH